MFLSTEELKAIGFFEIGTDHQISRKASFYRISGRLGDHVRIDDFCILKGHVEIGSHVHIAAFGSISGAWDKVIIADFASLSNRVSIFTGSDDFGASTLNNTNDDKYTIMRTGPVTIGIAALVGAHSVILPGVDIGDGGSVYALSVVARSIPAGGIARSAAGAAAMVDPNRKRDVQTIRKMAKEFLGRMKGASNFTRRSPVHAPPTVIRETTDLSIVPSMRAGHDMPGAVIANVHDGET